MTITSLSQIITMAEETFKYSNYWMIIARHPFISETWLPSARNEFNNAMLQPRYAVERENYEKYMSEQIASGLLETDDIHFATGFIIRKNCIDWLGLDHWFIQVRSR